MFQPGSLGVCIASYNFNACIISQVISSVNPMYNAKLSILEEMQ